MYTEWVKDGSVGGMPFHNPILNQTGDDPSTAWRTAHGEWRLIGNAGAHGAALRESRYPYVV